MATVIGDDGNEYEVQPVEASVAMVSLNSLNSEFRRGDARIIEEAMAGAARTCHEQGITDPETVKAAMLKARSSVKIALSKRGVDEQ